jgi:hypothetical protein
MTSANFSPPASFWNNLHTQIISLKVEELQLNNNSDTSNYIWCSNFVPSSAYKALIGHSQIHESYQWLWNCFCQPKHKVFFWLLIKDRLSTKKILKRRNMHLPSFFLNIQGGGDSPPDFICIIWLLALVQGLHCTEEKRGCTKRDGLYISLLVSSWRKLHQTSATCLCFFFFL